MKRSILLVLPLTAAALAQNSATIYGTISDAGGAVVPGAAVTVTHADTGATRNTVTDATGSYVVVQLTLGRFTLRAQSAGFKEYVQSDIVLQVGENRRADFALEVGSVNERVEVEAEAAQVETRRGGVSQVIDMNRVAHLPLNGRNPVQLQYQVPGVGRRGGVDQQQNETVSVNGSGFRFNNYALDGSDNHDPFFNTAAPFPNPDALQEFNVETSSYGAEKGRNSGAYISAVTKSGTNQLHGSAFEFLRNKAVNATNFFSPVVGGRKLDDGLKRNQFGGTLGGPVVLPKLYNGRDKSFFFFSYQGTRQRQVPITAQIVVPTVAMRGGDFSSLLPGRRLRDFTKDATAPDAFFAGNQIPAARISPISQAILNFIPPPSSGNVIFTAAPQPFDENQWLVKNDQQLGGNNRLSGRYYRSFGKTQGFLNPTNYLETTTGRTWLNQSISFTDTHIFGPTVTNQALFSFNRTDGNNIPVFPAKSFKELGINLYNDDRPQWFVAVAGYWGTLNTGDTNQFLRDEYQVSDVLRWTKGRHSISMGGEYGRGIGDVVNNFRANGRFTFNGSAPFTTDAFADFLLGKFSDIQQGIGEYRNTRFNRVSMFFADSFKVRRRFTLDLGVRYEPFFPYTELNNKIAAWHPGERSQRYPNAPLGVVFVGDPGVDPGGHPRVWNNLAPRVGFAWDVFGDGKTAIRGGYGIFFDMANTIEMNNQANQAPFGTVVTRNGDSLNSIANPYAGAVNPFPASLNPGSDATFPQFSSQFLFAGDMRNPYVQSFNLTVEREVKGGFVARASYAGSKATRLISIRELNPATFAVGATTATTNQRRPLAPGLGSTALVEPVANSTFNALQLTLERRFNNGFSILTNYQFSKSLDDGSGNKGTGISVTNPFNRRFDRGRSDFDRTHVFNLSGLWELPVKFQKKAMNGVLGGWNLNAIVSLMSGYPLTIGSGVDNARTGTGGQRADLIGDPYISGERTRNEIINQYLSKAAFAPNAIGTYGNLGRNTFEGPGYANLDLGLAKDFKFTERFVTTLRFETFNSLNRVNLNPPTTGQNSANFMRITAAQDPRILQFALRMRW